MLRLVIYCPCFHVARSSTICNRMFTQAGTRDKIYGPRGLRLSTNSQMSAWSFPALLYLGLFGLGCRVDGNMVNRILSRVVPSASVRIPVQVVDLRAFSRRAWSGSISRRRIDCAYYGRLPKMTAASSPVTLVVRTYDIFQILCKLLMSNPRPCPSWTLLPLTGPNKVREHFQSTR